MVEWEARPRGLPASGLDPHPRPAWPSAEPERLLLVPILEATEGARYVLVRWPDWPSPALLALAALGPHDDLASAVGALLDARLRLAPAAPPLACETRVPVRMPHPRLGLDSTTGWLRPVAVPVDGEPEPDVLLAGYEVLTLDEALDALPTDVEREALRLAAGMLGA